MHVRPVYFEGFGADALKGCKVSPDAFCQVRESGVGWRGREGGRENVWGLRERNIQTGRDGGDWVIGCVCVCVSERESEGVCVCEGVG